MLTCDNFFLCMYFLVLYIYSTARDLQGVPKNVPTRLYLLEVSKRLVRSKIAIGWALTAECLPGGKGVIFLEYPLNSLILMLESNVSSGECFVGL